MGEWRTGGAGTDNGSSSARPAAKSWSNRSLRELGAMVTTMHRGSNVSPSTTSPATTLCAQPSLRFKNVRALPGAGSAQSGLSPSTKKETSERDVLVVVKDARNGSLINTTFIRKGYGFNVRLVQESVEAGAVDFDRMWNEGGAGLAAEAVRVLDQDHGMSLENLSLWIGGTLGAAEASRVWRRRGRRGRRTGRRRRGGGVGGAAAAAGARGAAPPVAARAARAAGWAARGWPGGAGLCGGRAAVTEDPRQPPHASANAEGPASEGLWEGGVKDPDVGRVDVQGQGATGRWDARARTE